MLLSNNQICCHIHHNLAVISQRSSIPHHVVDVVFIFRILVSGLSVLRAATHFCFLRFYSVRTPRRKIDMMGFGFFVGFGGNASALRRVRSFSVLSYSVDSAGSHSWREVWSPCSQKKLQFLFSKIKRRASKQRHCVSDSGISSRVTQMC